MNIDLDEREVSIVFSSICYRIKNGMINDTILAQSKELLLKIEQENKASHTLPKICTECKAKYYTNKLLCELCGNGLMLLIDSDEKDTIPLLF
jgi:hypothetical protein